MEVAYYLYMYTSYICINFLIHTSSYINICVTVRIYTYWDVPPPSSSHQQHLLTFWLGGFTITFHCEWERSIPNIHKYVYIYALFLRCTYYIYAIFLRIADVLDISIYFYTYSMYIIYTNLYLQSISFKMPVTSRPSSVFFLENPWGKSQVWYSPTMR